MKHGEKKIFKKPHALKERDDFFSINTRKLPIFEMLFKSLYILIFFLSGFVPAYSQGIIINELSNGPSGLKEYYELLVVGPPCTTVDLRNWIVDDNNGDFAPGGLPGAGVGIAQGHIRLKNIANWSAVPVGSIILIYAETDKNSAITLPDDPTDSNGDCSYILPGNDINIEYCDTFPNNNSAAYGPCTFNASQYFVISLRNAGDAGQTRKPDGTYFHGISFGDIAGGPDNLMIDATTGTAKNYFFNTGSYTNAADYSSALVSGGTETPGAPNNAANLQYINNLKNDTSGISLGNDTVVCAGGAISLDAGPGYLTYLWSNGDTLQSVTIDTTGIFWVEASNAIGCGSCTARDTINIAFISPAATTVATNLTCNGTCDGTINLSLSSGTSPFTYSWSNAATTEDLSGLCAASYFVTVTDSLGCSDTASATVNQPTAISLSIATVNSTCGNSNGSATGSASGGVTGYTYLWSNAQTSAAATGLIAGNYTITVTDVNGCTATLSTTVNNTGGPIVTIPTSTNVSCFGGNDGSATAFVSGGTTSYTYLWAPSGGTGAIAMGLSAGNYSVTVTDANGCTAIADTLITQPGVLGALISSASNISCNGLCDGSATVTASGGTTPYNYIWQGGGTTDTKISLCAGAVNVTVTDAKGCSAITTATISQPPALTSSIAGANILCNGNCNGSANLSVNGGTTPYSYNWSNSGTTEDISSLCAGSFNVTVTDNNGCNSNSTVTISQLPAINLTTSSTNSNCGMSNGSATVTPSGGTPGYTYLWNDNQTDSTATGLAVSNYSVTVTDANSCTAAASVSISNIGAGTASITSFINPKCYGGNDGEATVNMSGNTTPFSYSWSSGGTSNTATGLIAAAYGVTVTDSTGCSAVTSITLIQPDSLIVFATTTDIPCNSACDGTASANVSGGQSPYTYEWSNSATAQNLSSLCSGFYSVTVVDSVGCTDTASVSFIEPAALSLSVSSTNSYCGNSNGSALVTPSGGSTPYSYLWNNGQADSTATGLAASNYSVSVTDADSCVATATVTVNNIAVGTLSITSFSHPKCYGGNDGEATVNMSGSATPFSYSWSSGATDSIATGLTAGTYIVTIIDSNGCSADTSITLIQPDSLIALVATTDAPCNSACDGTAMVNVSGGVSPYSYQWSDPDNQTGTTATGLCQGIYSVLVTDSNNCTITKSDTVKEPELLTLVLGTFNGTCPGACNGQGVVIPGGGTVTGNYNYNWQPIGITGNFPAINNLCSGLYTLTITDDNGCTTDTSFTISEPAYFTIYSSSSASVCGQSNGTASVDSVTGGTGGVNYSWDSNAASQISSTAVNLANGVYCVTITDVNGCDTSVCVTVNNISGPSITASTTSVTCSGQCDGTITASSTGGQTPYTYQWSGGSSTGLCAGNYIVTVTDANTCTDTITITIPEPFPLVIVASDDTTVCPGQPATISAEASGGTGIIIFSWNNGTIPGNGPHSITIMNDTCFTVFATDANICQSLPDTVCIFTGTQLQVSAEPIPPIICPGDDVILSCIVNGGIIPYTFEWSNGSTNQQVLVSPQGNFPASATYTVTVSDGCSPDAIDDVIINFYPLPNVNFILDSTYGCAPYPVTFINETLNSDSCVWDLGDGTFITDCNTFDHIYTDAGTYPVNLTVFNSFGCKGTNPVAGEIVVNQNPQANFSFTPDTTTVLNTSIKFFDLSINQISQWLWTFYDNDGVSFLGTNTIQNPSFEFPGDTGTYPVTLLVTNSFGCTDTITYFVIINDEFIVFIPNAFTPNGDIKNEKFFPAGVGIDENDFEFLIFDRWGDLIFQSNRLDDAWDGTARELGGNEIVQDGVYVWKLKVKPRNENVKAREYIGHVTLIK